MFGSAWINPGPVFFNTQTLPVMHSSLRKTIKWRLFYHLLFYWGIEEEESGSAMRKATGFERFVIL